jgi:hypothetical protein
MSEEGGESRSVGAFLLGFLTGVLVCLGIGGGFFVVVGRQSAMHAEMAARDAQMARMEAEEQRARAEAERQLAEETIRKAREAAKDVGEDVLPQPKELVEDAGKAPHEAKKQNEKTDR